VEVNAQIFTESGGEVRTCTVIRDFSERARMERELMESRARLAEAERIARMGSWEWDLAADRVTRSEGLLQIFGLAKDDVEPTSGRLTHHVYPDDRERVRSGIDRAIAQRSPFTLEFRAIQPDGRVHNLRSHGDVVVDDSGQPTRVVGIVQDITEAKLAREALETTSADLERRANELQRLALRTATEPSDTREATLTARQLEVLRLIAQGLTNSAIAERLVVTEGTVKWHVKQILAKTESANRTEAVARILGLS